jgi:hypothetical protein
MRLCSISLALLALGACSPLVATASDGWTIEREDMFQEEQRLIGKVQRSRITFTNGVQFLLPLERAQSLAVLRGTSGTAFLAARGANCTYCDENTSITSIAWRNPIPHRSRAVIRILELSCITWMDHSLRNGDCSLVGASQRTRTLRFGFTERQDTRAHSFFLMPYSSSV